MNYPPVFTLAAASSAVTALLGSSPCRVWAFGLGPDTPTEFYQKPYAVWQQVGGLPENYLDRVPDADNWSVQVDVYAESIDQARAVALALRDAYEPHAYITNWNGESRDPDTKNYRVSFDVDFIVLREKPSYTLGLSGDQTGKLLLSGDAQETGNDGIIV